MSNKNPGAAATANPGTQYTIKHSKSETKIKRVLKALAAGRSFNRFEAERILHDHALHSTVSSLQNGYGLTVNREFETVRGYRGCPTRVCRYWIDPEHQALAEKLVDRL